MSKSLKNPNHKININNLNRAVGQLEGIKKMIDEQRYCVEILQQLKAVQSAIKGVEQNILKTHMKMCLLNAVKSQDEEEINQKLTELQNLMKNYS